MQFVKKNPVFFFQINKNEKSIPEKNIKLITVVCE